MSEVRIFVTVRTVLVFFFIQKSRIFHGVYEIFYMPPFTLLPPRFSKNFSKEIFSVNFFRVQQKKVFVAVWLFWFFFLDETKKKHTSKPNERSCRILLEKKGVFLPPVTPFVFFWQKNCFRIFWKNFEMFFQWNWL